MRHVALVPLVTMLHWLGSPRLTRSPVKLTQMHGFQVVLSLPRRRFPGDALVRATVEVKNDSGRTVVRPLPCHYGNPAVQVVKKAGLIVYPPALPNVPPAPCPVSLAPRVPPASLSRETTTCSSEARSSGPPGPSCPSQPRPASRLWFVLSDNLCT